MWATISQSRIRAVGEPAHKTDEKQQDKCEPPTRDITIVEFSNTGQENITVRECKDSYRPSEEDKTRVVEGVIKSDLRVKP